MYDDAPVDADHDNAGIRDTFWAPLSGDGVAGAGGVLTESEGEVVIVLQFEGIEGFVAPEKCGFAIAIDANPLPLPSWNRK